MRQEKFKMERQGLIHIGDEVEISEFQSYMNYSYIIEPAVAMSGCYKNSERIKSTHGIIKNIEHTPRGFIVKELKIINENVLQMSDMEKSEKSLNMAFERVIYIYTTNPSFSYR